MQDKLVIGRFGKVYGIKGWLRVYSYTDPAENIVNYSPWWLQQNGSWQKISIEDHQIRGKSIMVKLPTVDDPEAANDYNNLEIAIERQQLPKLTANEFYWSELEGLTVVDTTGKTLGRVDHLVATGSNDVLVIKQNSKEHWLPYIDQVVLKIDLAQQVITVQWDED